MTIWDLLRSLSSDRTWKNALLYNCCWVSSFPSQCVLLPWGPFPSCPTCRRAHRSQCCGMLRTCHELAFPPFWEVQRV